MGLAPMAESAREFGAFVDGVLAVTRATRVLLVGYSQGGNMPRYWMRFLGGVWKTAGCVAISQWICLPDEVNANREVENGVGYTVISSELDEVITPWQSQYLAGPVSQVTNVALQSPCPYVGFCTASDSVAF
jgi:triacylglycerol esterase/lipase EstA (alpha/beta hydrolase family)